MVVNVTAIVVTYNKPKLLEKCLNAIANQSYQVTKLIIVDNGIEFDNHSIVKSVKFPTTTEVSYNLMDSNLGGAGGFAWGIEFAMSKQADFLWIMDDDTVANRDTLENLLTESVLQLNAKGDLGIVASSVLWKDGLPAKMNIPVFVNNEVPAGHLPNHVCEIKSSSFVSMLISTKAVRKVGYPIPEFFIWGDDVEYSTRIAQSFTCLFSPSSRVTHMMAQNTGVDIRAEKQPDRIKRHFYDVRNSLYILRKYGRKSEVLTKQIKYLILICLVIFKTNGRLKAKTIKKGLSASVSFNPRIKAYNGIEKS